MILNQLIVISNTRARKLLLGCLITKSDIAVIRITDKYFAFNTYVILISTLDGTLHLHCLDRLLLNAIFALFVDEGGRSIDYLRVHPNVLVEVC